MYTNQGSAWRRWEALNGYCLKITLFSGKGTTSLATVMGFTASSAKIAIKLMSENLGKGYCLLIIIFITRCHHSLLQTQPGQGTRRKTNTTIAVLEWLCSLPFINHYLFELILQFHLFPAAHRTKSKLVLPSGKICHCMHFILAFSSNILFLVHDIAEKEGRYSNVTIMPPVNESRGNLH